LGGGVDVVEEMAFLGLFFVTFVVSREKRAFVFRFSN